MFDLFCSYAYLYCDYNSTLIDYQCGWYSMSSEVKTESLCSVSLDNSWNYWDMKAYGNLGWTNLIRNLIVRHVFHNGGNWFEKVWSLLENYGLLTLDVLITLLDPTVNSELWYVIGTLSSIKVKQASVMTPDCC